MFNFLSLELLVVIAIIMIYTRYRKTTIFSVALVKGLNIYMPPSSHDFEHLQESLKPAYNNVRENSKGKKNKFDMKRAAKTAQKNVRFPLHQMEMGTELLQYCNKFFADFDFLLMLFHYSVLLLLCLLIMKLLVPSDLTQTNLTFYMTGITLTLVLANLRHGSFPGGFRQLTDETKMQLLFSMKTFIVVWCSLVYSEGALEQFLGLDI